MVFPGSNATFSSIGTMIARWEVGKGGESFYILLELYGCFVIQAYYDRNGAILFPKVVSTAIGVNISSMVPTMKGLDMYVTLVITE
jgi:hypothetical protein